MATGCPLGVEMKQSLFTYGDLAKRFQCSKSWLYAQVRKGKLKIWEGSTYRLTRFSEAEVRRFEGAASLRVGFDDFTATKQVAENTVTTSDRKR